MSVHRLCAAAVLNVSGQIWQINTEASCRHRREDGIHLQVRVYSDTHLLQQWAFVWALSVSNDESTQGLSHLTGR